MTGGQEVIEALRTGYQALAAAGEWPADGLLAADFELRQDPSVDAGKVFRGPGAPGELMGLLEQSFRDITLEVEDLVEAADDRIVATVGIRGHGKGSGMAIDKQQAHVWSFAAGRAAAMQIYGQVAEGFKAVGLDV